MEDWGAVRARLERTVEGIEPQFATPLVADIRAALERVEDYDAIRKERDYYAIEFSALTSDVPPGAKKTLLDTIRSLRQRVEELERDNRQQYEQLLAGCTCGSGGHPRLCARHPKAYQMHVNQLNYEHTLEERAEAAEAKLARCVEALDALRAENARLRNGALHAERIEELTRERDEARAKARTAEASRRAHIERAEDFQKEIERLEGLILDWSRELGLDAELEAEARRIRAQRSERKRASLPVTSAKSKDSL